MNQFTRATQVLERLARELNAPIAIVGGLAAIYHQVPVTTTDIDIVVPQNKLADFVAAASRAGLTVSRQSPSGWHAMEYHDPDGDVEIEVVPEGGRSPRDPPYAPPTPSPQQLGVSQGLGYASFAGWVALKLVAARDKDRYHLTEAFKQATEEQIASAVVWVRALHPSYLQELERLVRAAEDEKQENW
jgi:hypothetical protein